MTTTTASFGARERVLHDFEKGQLGLSANLPSVASASGVGAKGGAYLVHLLLLVMLNCSQPDHRSGSSTLTLQQLKLLPVKPKKQL